MFEFKFKNVILNLKLACVVFNFEFKLELTDIKLSTLLNSNKFFQDQL
ncbi:hypothetical protein GCM10023206_08900 [Acinetobacter puyangensis]